MTEEVKKNKGGRPKGSLNRLALNRTLAIQEAVTEEMLQEMVNTLFSDFRHEDCSVKDRTAIFDRLTKYVAVTPKDDVIEDVIKLTSTDDHAKAIELIKQRLLNNAS